MKNTAATPRVFGKGAVNNANTFAALAGAGVCGIGLLVLAGWAFDIAALKSVYPSLVAMAPNTAACFVLAGWSLWCHRRPGSGPGPRRIAQLGAAAVAVVGALTLVEYLAGVSLGIDELLVRAPESAVWMAVPGRMASATAGSFVLAGMALLALHRETVRAVRAAQASALLVGFAALLTTLGYLYGVSAFYTFMGSTAMALHTALAFLLLAAGVLAARPDRGWMRLLTSDRAEGHLARRLLPAALLVPVVLAWLRLAGQRRGLYETEFGLALATSSTVVLFAGLVWFTARALGQSEDAREQERGFSESLVAGFPGILCLFDESGRFVRWNRNLEVFTGYSAAEIGARTPFDLLDAADHAAAGEKIREAFTTGYTEVELPLVARDGRRTAFQLTGTRIVAEGVCCLLGAAIDISARKAAEEHVRRLNVELEARVRERTSELEAASQEMEAFTYSVSHDLRSPLRAIDGFSRVLVEDHAAALDEDGRRVVDVIQRETRRMGRLMDELLSLSRVGRQRLEPEPIDMSALARAALDEVLADAPDRVVDVTLPALPPAHGAPAMIRQVWVNLLANAVKFTRRSAHAAIEIGGSAGAGDATYFVRDNGAGFDPRFVDKLFQPFQRLHTEDEFEGTGIGLALVHRIVSRHGGRVWAEGRLGDGATFSFSLPARADAHVQEAHA